MTHKIYLRSLRVHKKRKANSFYKLIKRLTQLILRMIFGQQEPDLTCLGKFFPFISNLIAVVGVIQRFKFRYQSTQNLT